MVSLTYTWLTDGRDIDTFIGQGKTQLALEYCRKSRSSHSTFWVDATSAGTAFRSFENIGNKLAPGTNFPNPEAARTYVLKALENFTDPILFVFDNFDQPGEFSTVRDFFCHRAKIIFTSRKYLWSSNPSFLDPKVDSGDTYRDSLLYIRGLSPQIRS